MADRHQFRAKWHNYNAGIYFVTICTHNKTHIFGRIYNDEMKLNALGTIVSQCIQSIENHNTDVELLNHVIMPNHIHMVLTVGTRYIASASSEDQNSQSSANMGGLKQPKHGNICNDFHHNSRLASIIGTFKAAVTRMANRQLCNSSGGRDISRPYWQPRYHEHIILNERSFDKIMTYIDSNIEHWQNDCFNT